MRSISAWGRLSSAALAVLVLVSSLTCMTVACRVVCAAERGTALGAASAPADAALPPCHRTAEGGSSTAPAPERGCGSGTVCCSTWLHDRDVYVMPAPAFLPERGGDDVPALPVARIALEASTALVPGTSAPEPPALLPTRPAGPCAGRAPPAA